MIKEQYIRYTGVAGTALLFGALLLYFYDQTLSGRVFGFALAGVVALTLWILLAPQDLRGWLSGRQAAGGSTSLILTIMFTSFVIVVYNFVDRQNITLDYTYSESFSLNNPSLNTINRLKSSGGRMRLVGFFPRGNLREQEAADILLRQFDQTGGANIEVQFIDPDEEPLLASQYAYTEYIALSRGGEQTALYVSFINSDGQPDRNSIRPIWPINERSISTTIAQLMNTYDTFVYFTTGHTELDIESQADTGLGRAAAALNVLNIATAKVNLLTDDIPQNAAALIIAGNSSPFVPEEVEKIADYLENRDGRLIILANPPYVDATFGGESLPLLADSPLGTYLGERYGVYPQDTLVVDNGSSFDSEFNPVIASMNLMHPIMENITADTGIVFSLATSFRFTEEPQGSQSAYNRSVFVGSSNDSYGETSLQLLPSGTLTSFDPSADPRGPLMMGVSVSETNEINMEPGTRIVLVGDIDWVSNEFITNFPGNATLWANMVSWVIGSPDIVSIDAVIDPYILPIEATVQERQRISIITTLVIPGLVLLMGGIVWFVRRRY